MSPAAAGLFLCYRFFFLRAPFFLGAFFRCVQRVQFLRARRTTLMQFYLTRNLSRIA
jgi:hypothetical protein